MKSSPIVSVLLPVHNGQAFVGDAIDSILTQSFKEFELLVLNDGSTDTTIKVCRKFNDSRIRIVSSEKKIGLVETLNCGISFARGQLIARLDSDDIAVNTRLEKQVDFLNSHPDHGLIGSWMRTIGDRKELRKFPTSDEDIQVAMLFGNPFGHPSVMFRKNWDRGSPGHYSANFTYAEDYEYWTRLASQWKCANLAEPLTLYRIHAHQATMSDTEARLDCVRTIIAIQLKPLGVAPLPISSSCLHELKWWADFQRNSLVQKKFDRESLRRQKKHNFGRRLRTASVRFLSLGGFVPISRIKRNLLILRKKISETGPDSEGS